MIQRCDIAVVGGGMNGLTAALALARVRVQDGPGAHAALTKACALGHLMSCARRKLLAAGELPIGEH